MINKAGASLYKKNDTSKIKINKNKKQLDKKTQTFNIFSRISSIFYLKNKVNFIDIINYLNTLHLKYFFPSHPFKNSQSNIS